MGVTRPVILELDARFGAAVADAWTTAGARGFRATIPPLEAIRWDDAYAPVVVPTRGDDRYVVRGTVDEGRLDLLRAEVVASERVLGLYADEVVSALRVCPDAPPIGNAQDVAWHLGVHAMEEVGMDGRGVALAVVDSGLNLEYLQYRGVAAAFNFERSWAYADHLTPGAAAVGHGTMCGFAASIAASSCTLIDVVLLRSSTNSALLSEAIRAFGHLLEQIRIFGLLDQYLALVVSSSWGVIHPLWDFPVGDPGNYSDNPDHPCNRLVNALESYGADLLFPAGNNGYDCPDPRSRGVTSRAIYGANGHRNALCVGGVDLEKHRVGYSSTGPARLHDTKPDLCSYTHFSGSGVYECDAGTSIATQVAAGVLAAFRSQRAYDAGDPGTHPAALRRAILANTDRLGLMTHSQELGWGIVDGRRLATAPLSVSDRAG